MQRGGYHPNAYLERRRNVVAGLRARTVILTALDDRRALTVRAISAQAALNVQVIRHHLRLLEAERIVKRQGKRPYRWQLTGTGQRRLIPATERGV